MALTWPKGPGFQGENKSIQTVEAIANQGWQNNLFVDIRVYMVIIFRI